MAPSGETIASISSLELERLLAHYGFDRSSACARAMERYLALLEKWNARMNLTANSSWECVGPLFEEAIWAAQFFPAGPSRHLDIGSGAGFPAVPMRVWRPQIALDMVESRARRCAFLETVASELGLEGVRVFNARLDAFLTGDRGAGGWDVVSWKAVRLAKRDLKLLLDRCDVQTQFWMFHSEVLSVSEPGVVASQLKLLHREPCPARNGWFLSIYLKR